MRARCEWVGFSVGHLTTAYCKVEQNSLFTVHHSQVGRHIIDENKFVTIFPIFIFVYRMTITKAYRYFYFYFYFTGSRDAFVG